MAKSCVARTEDRIKDLPAISPRSRTTKRHFVAFILERRGRILVRQRPKGMVNAFLWEFPNVELILEDCNLNKVAKKELGVVPVLRPFCSIKHTITRFRITLEVFRALLPNGISPRANGRWLAQTDLERLPFTSAHKQVLLKLRARQQASA